MTDITANAAPSRKNIKRLAIFCDGTWNKEDQKSRDNQPCPTNVPRLVALTRTDDGDGCPQIVHYVRGVGNRWQDRVAGGGFGYGISDNIKDAYRFLVSNYDNGDEIFLFGFSRGAFTVRSLAGMIYNVGILKRENLHLVEKAFDIYRSPKEKWLPASPDSMSFKESYTHGNETIKFLGVWDTVGALGAPFGAVFGWLLNIVFPTQFHDTKISRIVLNAYHATSIDEKRWPFRPTRMELTDTRKKEIAHALAAGATPECHYEEVWFPGVHSDVGGGYDDSSLSDCALQWMAEKAAHHGLHVQDLSQISSLPFHPDPLAQPHDSQTGWYRVTTKLFVYWPKALLKLIWKNDTQIDRVQENGDFIRQIDMSDALAADVAAFPIIEDFKIDLSDCAREKLDKDGDYRPLNLARGRPAGPAPTATPEKAGQASA